MSNHVRNIFRNLAYQVENVIFSFELDLPFWGFWQNHFSAGSEGTECRE